MTQKQIDLGFEYLLYVFLAAIALFVFRIICIKLRNDSKLSILKKMPDILEGFVYLLSAWLLFFNLINMPIKNLPNMIAVFAIFFALNTGFTKFLNAIQVSHIDYNKIERLQKRLDEAEAALIRLQHKKKTRSNTCFLLRNLTYRRICGIMQSFVSLCIAGSIPAPATIFNERRLTYA